MELGDWFSKNWFVLLQTAGIVGSLLFTGISLRRDAKGRKITNLIDLTANHRDLWSEFSRRPELKRVLDPKADTTNQSPTDAEKIFVTLIVVHLNSVYHALDDALTVTPEGIREDVRSLFSLPIPRAVWDEIKTLQDKEFVRFIEACLRGEATLRWRIGRRFLRQK
jgi:hypothetical protein